MTSKGVFFLAAGDSFSSSVCDSTPNPSEWNWFFSQRFLPLFHFSPKRSKGLQGMFWPSFIPGLSYFQLILMDRGMAVTHYSKHRMMYTSTFPLFVLFVCQRGIWDEEGAKLVNRCIPLPIFGQGVEESNHPFFASMSFSPKLSFGSWNMEWSDRDYSRLRKCGSEKF